jgi:HlyD family secretion protein
MCIRDRDAFESKVLPGKVSNISLLSSKNATGGTIFEVTIIVDPKSETLREGMTGDVDITVDSKKQVLSVPFESVKTLAGKSTVMVVEGGKAKQKTIRTGLASDTSYEVLSGLNLGDMIITNKTTEIKDGQLVSVSKNGRIGQ